jgi:hypothetical protein
MQLHPFSDMQIAADLQRALADGGPKTLVTRTLRRLVRPAFKAGSLVFAECDLRAPFPEPRAVPGIAIREATIADATLFEDESLFLERIRQGHRCFMGIEEKTGKLANYRWINTSVVHFPEINRYLVLKPNEVYAFDLKTLPEFRRRGIDAYTRNHVYSYLGSVGYTKLYAYIHGDNHPSLKASRHFLKPIGRIWYVQIRGCQPIMVGGRSRNFPELRRGDAAWRAVHGSCVQLSKDR